MVFDHKKFQYSQKRTHPQLEMPYDLSKLKTSADETMQTESVWDSANCVESGKFISYGKYMSI